MLLRSRLVMMSPMRKVRRDRRRRIMPLWEIAFVLFITSVEDHTHTLFDRPCTLADDRTMHGAMVEYLR